jgi:hypothetical protein
MRTTFGIFAFVAIAICVSATTERAPNFPADVRFDSEGSYILVSAPRLYDLVKNTAFGSHLLTLRPQGCGITLHAFSYGNDCQQGVAPL